MQKDRREFLRAGVAGAFGALFESSSQSLPIRGAVPLVAEGWTAERLEDLARETRVALRRDEVAAEDFGHLVRGSALVVARPGSTEEVVPL